MRKDAPPPQLSGKQWSKHHPKGIAAPGSQVGSGYPFILFSY